jgi:hypothetical protein
MEKKLIAQVATILEKAGWRINVEENMEGIRIDLLAQDLDATKVIIECKAYNRLVGLRTIREFASTVSFLREPEPSLTAWLITTSGFTSNAQKALAHHRIQGYTLGELQRHLGVDLSASEGKEEEWEKQATKIRRLQRRIFVIMPFSEEMLDVFILGIRWAAKELNIVAERADDLEHNGEIINEIRTAIKECDVVIADTSGANPNVCYEVGYAHALDKPTVLICRRGEKLPFDLQGTNHLMYSNIISLREPLKAKLASALVKPIGPKIRLD